MITNLDKLPAYPMLGLSVNEKNIPILISIFTNYRHFVENWNK